MATPDDKQLIRRAQKRVHEMTDHQLEMKIKIFETARVPSNLPKDRRNMEQMEAAAHRLSSTVNSLRLMVNALNMDCRGDLANLALAAEQRVLEELQRTRHDIENPTEKSAAELQKEEDERKKREEERKAKKKPGDLLENVLFEDVRGLWMLPEMCSKIEFQGKGREAEDLAKLMRNYLVWARDVAKVKNSLDPSRQAKHPMKTNMHDFGSQCMKALWPPSQIARAWDLRYEYKTGKRPKTEPAPEEAPNAGANAAQADPAAGAAPEDAARAAALARLRAHTQAPAQPGAGSVPTPEERARAAANRQRAMEIRAAKAAARGETAAPPGNGPHALPNAGVARDAQPEAGIDAALGSAFSTRGTPNDGEKRETVPASASGPVPDAAPAPPMTEEMREQIRQRRLAAMAKQAARKAEATAATQPDTQTAPASATVPDTLTAPASATVPDTAPVPASASTAADTAAASGPTQLLDELLDEPLFAERGA